MKPVLLVFLWTILAPAQNYHTVSLTWQDTQTATYNVYRAPGNCSGSPVFTRIADGVAAKSYTDLDVPVGTYCYQVTAAANGLESLPSNSVAAAVKPFPPAALDVVVK